MIIYEVTATVRADLCDTYERFMLDRHVPDVLATDAFTEASFERSDESRYRARYFARSRESLDNYFAKDAPRLRSDFSDHFPDGIELARDEWTVLERFA